MPLDMRAPKGSVVASCRGASAAYLSTGAAVMMGVLSSIVDCVDYKKQKVIELLMALECN